jgi:integrase
MVTAFGRTLPIGQWATLKRIPLTTLRSRLATLPAEEALTRPVAAKFRPQQRPAPPPVVAPPLKRDARGYARVRYTVLGEHHTHTFGRHGTPESVRRYEAWAEACMAGGKVLRGDPGRPVSVAELADAFTGSDRYARYSRGERANYALAIRELCARHAAEPVTAFDPLALEQLQYALARRWVRASVNRAAWRVVSIFGWGVTRGMVPEPHHRALALVPGLRRGQRPPGGGVPREGKKVRPPDPAAVAAALEHLHPTVRAMVAFQRTTGCRPVEVCCLTVESLDRSGREWRYRVPDEANKLLGLDEELVYWLGPQAQAALAPLLLGRPAGYVFHNPRSRRLGRWTTAGYRKALGRACRKAGVAPFGPHALRHERATEVRRRFGSEAAQVVLNHRTPTMVEVYAERDADLARKVAREAG